MNTNFTEKLHKAVYERFVSVACLVTRKEMKEMKGTLWRNLKTNTTNRFLDLKNPILETKIIFLRGPDQKLLQKTCLWVMAENVSSTRTSRVRVAQNVFAQFYVPEYRLPCKKIWGSFIN